MKRILPISLILILLFPIQVNAKTMPTSMSFEENVVKIAYQYVGYKYCRGGESPRCFDCSGFTQYVYSKMGIDLPRTGNFQLRSMKRVLPENAKPGDLVFFSTKNGYIYHVGIYIGDGLMIHSPKPGQRVKIAPVFKRAIYATIQGQFDNL